MSKYDILFFDIDGTLVRDDHFTLSPRTRDALLAAREAGVKLAVASGRCLHILPEEVMALGMDYAVTSNGAAVYDLKAGKQIYYNGVKAEKAAIVCRIVHPIDSFIEFFAEQRNVKCIVKIVKNVSDLLRFKSAHLLVMNKSLRIKDLQKCTGYFGEFSPV